MKRENNIGFSRYEANNDIDLSDFATKEFVAEEILNVQTGGSVNLDDYVKKDYMIDKILSSDGAINVRDYGAKGDGIADDTTSIQNALNYASEHELKVLIPKGTYIISNIQSNVSNNMTNKNNGLVIPSNSFIKMTPQTVLKIKPTDSDNYAILNLSYVGNWDISKVTNMSNMLYGCSKLTDLYILNWTDLEKSQTAINTLPVGNDSHNIIHTNLNLTPPNGWIISSE